MDYPKSTQRLNKALVQLGLSPSRRKADELIMTSKVKVNGTVITKLATTVLVGSDEISVSGKLAKPISSEIVTIVLNKPSGYVCSHNPQGNDRSIFALLPEAYSTLKIAGRLDKDSEGLVLLTSSGDLANQLSHPRYEKSKQYEVTINKPLTSGQLVQLRKGVKLHDGVSKFDKVVTSKPQQLIVTLHEGRNRQIRRTFAHIDTTVTNLKRTQLGSITLKHLASGKYRKVDTIEL